MHCSLYSLLGSPPAAARSFSLLGPLPAAARIPPLEAHSRVVKKAAMYIYIYIYMIIIMHLLLIVAAVTLPLDVILACSGHPTA